jgi:FkbM family methyltransferase
MREDIDVYMHLKRIGLKIDLVLDVGVGVGTEDLYSSFASSNFVMVEPLELFNNQISLIAKKYNLQFEVYNFAASHEKKESIINIHDNPSGSSLLLEKLQTDEYNGSKKKILLDRLDSINTLNKYSNIFLKIDVQGPNIDVLRGSMGFLNKVDVIQIEAYFFDTFESKDDQSIKALINFLDEHGFRFFDFSSPMKRPLDGSIIQMEMFFLKKDNQIFQDPRFKI